ncbi:MT-A70-domain-containing protein [Macroventuria anomochaeta]|uniref:MT-A70-domain-containing protein n=1 Tax=Macroventuria anomochaeta TaxID=301207 RepID=A0ACB6SC46_9PLEO|nr:MT-A70-domain-containing protein [Macroventuria anomochaeta]KAF2631881.1 MT-A70-domain-containing protein [Macroventuria anomochaeta]
MTATHDQWSAILYQSADREITLVDIPTSIATAQGRTGTLLSTSPLEEPIQSKEEYQPKASKITGIASADTARYEVYKSLIQQALLDIKAHVPGSWCAPRQIFPHLPKYGKDAAETNDVERELEHQFREWAAGGESRVDDNSFDFQTMMASLGAPEVQPAIAGDNAQRWIMSCFAARDADLQDGTAADWSPAFYNAESQTLNLTIARAGAEKEQMTQAYNFTVPPLSAFFLGDCDHPDSFRSAFREVTNKHNLPRHFDLVLLDPPWPNRSAKRKGAYEQVGGMPYLKKMLLKMDIDNYLEHNALVGIWITNKSALRDHVLGPGGLFETWNVGLIEEWIWIKTTTKGDPMFDIDDTMRKPYEVLLLGRAAPNAWTTMTHASSPRKRVIAAVPDIHSRKPCLKELLEPYVPEPTDYSALEVFARYLVAGWTSWGNEVLKYNSNIYWAKDSIEQQRSVRYN